MLARAVPTTGIPPDYRLQMLPTTSNLGVYNGQESLRRGRQDGQTNIGLTAFLLSVFIITIIYVVRYIRSKRAAAAAITIPAIEYQPPVDPITRSMHAPPASIVVPIEDPITPPRSPRVPVLPTNVTNASDKGGRVTNPHRRFSVRWPSIPESVR